MPPKKNVHTTESALEPVIKKPSQTAVPAPVAPPSAPTPTQAEMLFQMNERLEALQKDVRKINKKFFWLQVSGWFKLIIIFAPLIIGVVYLMPFLDQAVQFYKTLLSELAPISELSKSLPQGGAGAGGASLDQLLQGFLKSAQ